MSRYDRPRWATEEDAAGWRKIEGFSDDVGRLAKVLPKDPPSRLDVEDPRETDSQIMERLTRSMADATAAMKEFGVSMDGLAETFNDPEVKAMFEAFAEAEAELTELEPLLCTICKGGETDAPYVRVDCCRARPSRDAIPDLGKPFPLRV